MTEGYGWQRVKGKQKVLQEKEKQCFELNPCPGNFKVLSEAFYHSFYTNNSENVRLITLPEFELLVDFVHVYRNIERVVSTNKDWFMLSSRNWMRDTDLYLNQKERAACIAFATVYLSKTWTDLSFQTFSNRNWLKFINASFSSSGMLENVLHKYALKYYQFPSQIVNNPMKKTTQKCQTCFYLFIWRQMIQFCISVWCKLVLDVI